jgi:hypothetical protein
VGSYDVWVEQCWCHIPMGMNLIFHDLLVVILEVYIDDVVVKSANFDDHMADLQVALERMKKYGLKMNPLKCAFSVSAGRFLGFIVYEKGIQVDKYKRVYKEDGRTGMKQRCVFVLIKHQFHTPTCQLYV